MHFPSLLRRKSASLEPCFCSRTPGLALVASLPGAYPAVVQFPKAQGGKFKIDRIMFRGAGGPQIWEDGGEMGLDAFAANFYRTRGGTLLGVVARHGNADMVEALLDMGTDINQGNKELGLTPLMFAAIEVSCTVRTAAHVPPYVVAGSEAGLGSDISH